MASVNKVVELRQMLAERFPGMRLAAGGPSEQGKHWVTGLPQVDELLGGGLLRGGITEVVSAGPGSGSALLLHALVRQAHAQGDWLALVDGNDSFDAAAFDNDQLARLLWVRCAGAKEAIKAADILLRDGNIALITLDLALSARMEWRGIPSSAWHRLHRLAEARGSSLLVTTPEPLVANSNARLFLDRQFHIEDLEEDQQALCDDLTPRLAEERAQFHAQSRSA